MLSPEERRRKIEHLLKQLKSQRTIFKKSESENQTVTRISFEISELIAKKMKPFQDGDYLKEAMAIFCKNICPEKQDILNKISLSRFTVVRRVEEISKHVQCEISKKCDECEFFSLAIDEMKAQILMTILNWPYL